MKRLNGHEWKAIIILAVLVPVGLLAAFKLTGMIKEPLTIVETIKLESVEWECDRPRASVSLNDQIRSEFTDGNVSVLFSLSLDLYRENVAGLPFYGGDALDFSCYVNATAESGSSGSFLLSFLPMDLNASIIADDSSGILQSENVSVTDVKSAGTVACEAYISAETNNSSCSLSDRILWLLSDQNCETHRLNLTLEYVFWADDAYKKAVFPMMLEVAPDVGNTINNAKDVQSGEYRACIDNVDTTDVYAIILEEGQTVNMTLTPPEDANYDLYLYNPSGEIVASSESMADVTESIIHHVEVSGTWYVEVKQRVWYGHRNDGIYILTIC